jgi:hypothetical protein
MAIDDTTHWARRSVPTDIDRERIRVLAEQAVKSLRQGLAQSVLDVRLTGLHGASIQRVYVKFVLRGLVRWLAETVSAADLVTYAHHVTSQDGAAAEQDRAIAALLRCLARL